MSESRVDREFLLRGWSSSCVRTFVASCAIGLRLSSTRGVFIRMGHSFPDTHIFLWAVLIDILHSSRGACYRRSPKDIREQGKQSRLHTEHPHFRLTNKPLSIPTGDGALDPLKSLGGSKHTYRCTLACKIWEIHVALRGAVVHRSTVQYSTTSPWARLE